MVKTVLFLFLRLVRKLAMAAVVAVLTLATYGLWLYGRDQVSLEDRRTQLEIAVQHERVELADVLVALANQHNATSAELARQQQRAVQADKALGLLHELDPGVLDRIIGDREQQKSHEAHIARMEQIKAETAVRITELQRESALEETTRLPRAERLALLDQQAAELREQPHPVIHYARTTWQEARGWVLAAFLLYLFGGVLLAAIAYFLGARLVAAGSPLHLAPNGNATVTAGRSALTIVDALWPGEVLWVRKAFLQSADDGLARRARRVLSWRSPASFCLAGLTGLIELRNARSDGERRVVFSCEHDAQAELVSVAVPEGGSFVVRAAFVQGVISPTGKLPGIRRRWRPFSWQSWITGQFGYFESTGPCRLIISCVCALEVSTLAHASDAPAPIYRTQSGGTVGFSPRLALKPVRSEGFWRYLRGQSPLFETEVTGAGVFLTRDTRTQVRLRNRRGVCARVLNLLGL